MADECARGQVDCPASDSKGTTVTDHVMFDVFHLDDSPEGRDRQDAAAGAIQDVVHQHELLLSHDKDDDRDSDLDHLSASLPSSPLHLSQALRDTATMARLSLELVANMLVQGTNAALLTSPMRTAMIASGRILCCLAPPNLNERIDNAGWVLLQEVKSYDRAMRRFAEFTTLTDATASSAQLADIRQQKNALAERSKGMTDAAALDAAAKVLAAAVGGETSDTALVAQYEQTLQEHFALMFNRYSGFAHGYGWPIHHPPGELWADLGTIATAASIAIRKLNASAHIVVE